MDTDGIRRPQRWSLAALASLAYAALGAIWITVSDRVAEALIPDVAQLTLFQSYKGWLFVAGSALAMYLLMRRAEAPRPASATGFVAVPARRAAAAPDDRLPLAAQLMGLVLAVAVPLCGLLGWFIYRSAEDDVASANRLVADLARITAQDTARFVGDTARTMAALARRERVRALDPGRCDPGLAEVPVLNPTFLNASTASRDGRLVCSAVAPPPGVAVSFADAPIHQKLLREGRFVISQPLTGPISGRLAVVASAPIRDDRGGISGAINFVVDVTAFRPVVRPVLPQSGVIAILDTQGTVIFGEALARVGKDAREAESVRIAIRERSGTVVARGFGGVLRAYAYTPVEGTDWIVLAGLPTDLIYGEARAHAWRGGLFGLAIILVAAAAGAWLARRIAAPVLGIAGAARRAAEGDLRVRAPEAGAREVVEVARQFNRMLDRVPLIESELRESERRYRNLFESSPECVFVHAGGRIVMINRAGVRLYGAESAQQMVGMAVAALAHPDDRAEVKRRIHQATYERRELAPLQLKNLRLDGSTIVIEAMSQPFDYLGQPAVLTQLRDITGREAAERRVTRLTNLYAALSRSNEAMVREPDRAGLARAVCGIVVEVGQVVTAVIRMYDAQKGAYVPLATHGPVAGWVGEREVSADESGSRFAIAVRERRTYVCNDIAGDTEFVEARADALALGVESSAIFPMLVDGAVAGALTVFAGETGFFDPELTALFEEMARNLAFAFLKQDSELALKQSEERYRALVEAAPDAIAVLMDGRVVMANSAAVRLYHASGLEQLIGIHGLELTDPAYHAEVREAVDSLMLDPGRVMRAETRHLRLDGSAFDAEIVRATFVYYGKPALQVIVRDISERKAAERRITRLSNLYAALSRTNAAIARETGREELCRTVCRIAVEHGSFVTAFIGMLSPQRDFAVPVGAAGRHAGLLGSEPVPVAPGTIGAQGPMARAMREGRSMVSNNFDTDPGTTAAHADASKLGIRASAAFPLFLGGQVVGALSVYAAEPGFFDAELTELLQEMALNLSFAFAKLQSEAAHQASEMALRDSEARYRSLFSTSPVGIYVRQDDRVVLINPAGQKLFGAAAPEQIIGKLLTELVHPDYHPMMQRRLAGVMADGKPAPAAESKHIRLDGSVVETEGMVIPFEFQGRPAVQVILTDITVRKESERAMLRLNAELEERVRQRTAELERANQELSEFSYIVSHDLKAPLRGIASLVNWLEQDHAAGLGEEGRELLRLMSTRSRRMHRLIEDILHFSRLGRGHQAAVEVDLGVLVPEVIDSLDVPAHIEVRLTTALPRVTGTETQLRQVFQNLISNAVKFIDKPRGLVSVGASADGAFWRIQVADNGPGIEPRHQERIFEIFQTLSARDDPESTGIGLTVVKKIVELLGGRIWVESQPGEGARFIFTLPRQESVPAAADAGVIAGGEEGL